MSDPSSPYSRPGPHADRSGVPWEAGTRTRVVISSSRERPYQLHVPPTAPPRGGWPVVVMFHGGGGTAPLAMNDTGWPALADRQGFLAVFPEGSRPDPGRPPRFMRNPQTWNDGSPRQGAAGVRRQADDVAFFQELMADLQAHFPLDASRIYLTGFSNGASLTFRLARQLGARIAAIAPVAGTDWLKAPPPDPAVSVLYLTGTADPVNPIQGGPIHLGHKFFGQKPPLQEMLGPWIQRHADAGPPRVVCEQDGIRGVLYGHPGMPDVLMVYTLDGHGHHWPGGGTVLSERFAGKNTSRLNATQLIWDFFQPRRSPHRPTAWRQ